MDGGAASAIEVLDQTLINVSKEEISLIRGLHKDAEQLKTTLGMIQSYLSDAEKKVINQDAVKKWLRELETLAFRADNVLDEFNYHLLHHKIKTSKVLPSFFSSFNHITRTRDVAQTIRQIDMDFKSLTQKSAVFGLEAMVVNAPAAVPDAAFETDSLTLDPIFIGRDDEVPKLVTNLTESPGEQFSIVAVVGMGGVGKTTLARKVFNHERVNTQFGSHIWVHVSQTFDPNMIFKKILGSQTDEAESREDETNEVTGNRGAISEKFKKSFKATTNEVETKQEILKKLQKALKVRTYLLVLDDIWNENAGKWEDFIYALAGVTSMKGNGIILTTRNAQVASIANPIHTHHLNGLSDEDCWSIIKTKAFGNGDVPSAEFETLFLKGDISEFKFSDYKNLHVLNLAGCDKLSSSIRKLIHLRNLNISETKIKYLPGSVGELHHLQTLRADTPYLRKLPGTLKYLISFRHLYLSDGVKCPPEMGRLTALQTLTHFTVGHEKGCRIEELGSLKNLKGKLKICSLENVHSKDEAEKAKISQKPNVFELRFEWDWVREGERTDEENVLEGLQPHPNLKKLEISFMGFEDGGTK